jgi:hypothetical protein
VPAPPPTVYPRPNRRKLTPPTLGKSPFDVKLTAEQKTELVQMLAEEIDRALAARGPIINPGGDLDYWHWLYKQGKRNVKDLPFPGAADLSTWIIAEKVDAMRARFCKTIFVEPVWVVDGWGAAAPRASLVEEFHQWKQEEERLQGWLQRTLQLALIEGTGVLECSEKADMIKRRKVRQLLPETTPGAQDGDPDLIVADDRGVVAPPRDAQGAGMVAEYPDETGAVTAPVDEFVPVRRGPSYRNVSLRDFLILPAHAQDDSEVWCYAKRFWRRLKELKSRAKSGLYDKDAVEGLSATSDRTRSELPQSVQAAGIDVAAQSSETTIEKELWELHVLLDLDNDGSEEWYIITLSAIHRQILRVQLDDMGMPRYLLFRPAPNPLNVYGDSHVDKLASIGEEHMGTRNAIADRSNLVNNAPIKRLRNSGWDMDEEPWGVGAVITVQDMQDVQPVTLPDVPGSMAGREQAVIDAAERLSGLNDVTLGSAPQESRTLGEVQMVTEQSFVRIEEQVRNLQETMEDLFKIRHELWRRAADEAPLEPSERFMQQLQFRSIDMAEGGIDGQALAGTFHGKPHGSVESADKSKQRSNYNGFMQVMGGFAQMNPTLQQVFASPDVIIPLFEQALSLYDSPNKGQMMRSLRQWQVQTEQQAQMAAQQPPPGPPGAQPGAPPPPGGPPAGAGAPPPPGGPGAPPPGPPPQGGPPAPPQGPPPGGPPPPMMGGMPPPPPDQPDVVPGMGQMPQVPPDLLAQMSLAMSAPGGVQ